MLNTKSKEMSLQAKETLIKQLANHLKGGSAAFGYKF